MNPGGAGKTLVVMIVYEAVLWFWFQADHSSLFPGIAVIPLVMLFGIAKVATSEPSTSLGALMVGGVSLFMWTAIFHGLPAMGLYKFFEGQRPSPAASSK